MNDLPVLGFADIGAVVAGFVAYAVFLVVASFMRLGRGLAPLISFNRAHLRMTSLYFALATAALVFCKGPFRLAWAIDLMVGLFFYFGLHYAIFLNFFGMAKASVSSSIISIAFSKGGIVSRAEIVGAYAGGLGFDYIKRSRLERLEVFLKWVERLPTDSTRLRVTASGAKAIATTRFFLNAWGLTQLREKT